MEIFGVLFLFLTISMPVTAQPSQKPAPGLHKAELKRMMQTAHTADQYEQLAAYFEQRSIDLERKAGQKQRELDDLLASRYHSKAYAIQVETARNWLNYYRKEISTCSERAKEYRLYAGTAVPASTFHGAGQQ